MATLIKAFAAQFLGLALAILLASLAPGLLHGTVRLALLQATAAAACAYLLRQPPWWLPIHLLFLPTALALLSLQLPSGVYLAITLLLALVFWGTVKGDVPLFLSSSAAADAVARIIERENAENFADLGAGIGSLAIPLARCHPLLAIDAVELAPLPWLITALRCRKLANIQARRASFWHCGLNAYDVVFAFLSPAVMLKLSEKISRDMRSGSLFISSSFPIPDWQPESVITLADRRKTRLYCYRIT
ncbi:MAG: class I SAM-dependent methyltransferase [Methylovulum sp.]|nr:class I SAM-dependent methyltransferase [Methylovulum sp.]